MKVLLLFAVLCLVAAGARPLSRDSFIEAEARFRLDTKTGFATPEHETLGNEGLAEAKKAEPKAAAGDAIKLNDKVTMSFGELVALGGDFMGPTTTKDVLCLKASKEAVKTTVDGWAKTFSKAQYDNLKNVKKREADLIAAAVKTGKPAEDAVGGKIGEGLTQDYIHASKGMKPAKHSFIGYLQDTLSKSPYVQMAKVNYDHFFHRDCSRKAYHYCHELAHDAAKKGDLNQAMIYEGFANHYLTDRFAPGHIRTPRQGLSLCNGKVALGDALSKCQHDEDNKTGLTVKNSKGESWLAYGDGRLPNANNAANKKRAIDAVAASIQELFKADLPKEHEGAEALAPVSVDATANKHKPLFKEEAGALMYRTAVDLAKVPATGEVKYDKVTGDLCVVILLDCWEFNKGVAKFMDNLSWTYMMARHKIIQAGKGLKKVGEKVGQGAKAVGKAVKNGAKSIANGVKSLLPKKKKKMLL